MVRFTAHFSRSCLAGMLGLALSAGASAQVPDGWYVMGSLQASAAPGPGGIHLLHPRNGSSQPITGLPQSLVALPGVQVSGTNAVAYHRQSDAILAGDIAWNGATAHMHVIHLTGAASNANSFTIPLGSAGQIAGIHQIQCMSNGAVLFLATGVNGGPMANEVLGTANLGIRTVTPIMTTNRPPGMPIAMAFDPASRLVFVAFVNSVTSTSVVAVVPLAGGSFAPPLVTVAGAINAMHMDNGLLAVNANSMQTTRIHWLHPASGAIMRTQTVPLGYGGFVPEPVTGGYMLTGSGTSNPPQSVRYMDAQGATTLVATSPAGGWGALSMIDWKPDPIAFGQPSPQPSPTGGPQYRWQLAPNAGGLPLSGNTSFAVQIADATGNPMAPGFWFASFAPPANPPWQPIPGIDVYLAPGAILTGGFLNPNAANPGTINLPIPPGRVGTSLRLQTFHLNSIPATSEGLRITVL